MLNTVVVGAGPYGLSVAAHLRNSGVSFRIFGRLMDSWLKHMPEGMCLKSDGFASNIYDPGSEYTLERFCDERKIEYGHTGVPVRLETFTAYGAAFKERMLPQLEDRVVVGLEQKGKGYLVTLDNGETMKTRRVVLAIGITHYRFTPDTVANLPAQFLSHSFDHNKLATFKGRSVIVVGGGSSATDLAGLLRESGVEVKLVTRREELVFHSKPTGKPRPLWKQIRHPQSGLGPGMRSRFFADFPMVFHHLPESVRLEAVRRTLGPSGGWFIKDKIVGKVPLLLGSTIQRSEVRDGKACLHIRNSNGAECEVEADHIVAATGYKVNLNRLQFLSPEIRKSLKSVNNTPVLKPTFESSLPGLYFTGVSAANSFGPVMRFAFGAGFAARTIAKDLKKSMVKEPVMVSATALGAAEQP